MTTLQVRRGTAAEWATTNPILALGEPGFETDTGRLRVGDGATAFTSLPAFVDESELPTMLVARRDSLTYPTGGSRAGGLYLYIGDSLTAGAASSSVLPYIEKASRGFMGDGGPGFHLFTNSVRVDRAAVASWTMTEFGLGGATVWEQYAPAGVYATVDGKTLAWRPASRWDSATVIYMKSPGGGTFTIGADNRVYGTELVINTGTVNADGTGGAVADYELASVTLTNPAGAHGGISVWNTTGTICLIGADFRVDAAPSGYRYGSLALGGRTLAQYANISASAWTQLLAILAPAAWTLNLGMNDRVSADATAHEANLTTLTSALQAGAPAAAGWMIHSTEPSDHATTNFSTYATAKRAVAAAHGLGYWDERHVIGTYDDAVVAGLMADTVHPNAAGNQRRASGLLDAMGIPAYAADPGATPYTHGSTAGASASGDISQRQFTTTAAATSTAVYTLGMVANYSHLLIELETVATRTGTSGYSKQRHLFRMSNNVAGQTLRGQATGASAVTRINEIQTDPGDAGLQSVTVTCAIVANALEVTLTLTYAGTCMVWGKWHQALAGATGARLIEIS